MQIEKLHFSMSEDQSHILIKFYYAFPMPGKSSRLAKGVDTHHQEGWERETEVVMAAGRSASLDFVDGAPPPALVDVPDLPFTFSRARVCLLLYWNLGNNTLISVKNVNI